MPFRVAFVRLIPLAASVIAAGAGCGLYEITTSGAAVVGVEPLTPDAPGDV